MDLAEGAGHVPYGGEGTAAAVELKVHRFISTAAAETEARARAELAEVARAVRGVEADEPVLFDIGPGQQDGRSNLGEPVAAQVLPDHQLRAVLGVLREVEGAVAEAHGLVARAVPAHQLESRGEGAKHRVRAAPLAPEIDPQVEARVAGAGAVLQRERRPPGVGIAAEAEALELDAEAGHQAQVRAVAQPHARRHPLPVVARGDQGVASMDDLWPPLEERVGAVGEVVRTGAEIVEPDAVGHLA